MDSKRKKEKKILIVGTGALATLFSARFASVGIAVTILGTWTNALDALQRDGACLIDSNGQQESHAVRVMKACEKTDIALVLVKSWQTTRVARQLSKCLAPDGLAITLQNGLGNDEILASALGVGRVVQGVTTTGAALVAPGVVQAGGEGLVSLETHPALGAFTALLTEAGFQFECVTSAAALVWSKLVINAAINPLTALLDIPNGALLERPSAKKLMGKIALETAAVAAVQKIPLSFDDPVKVVESIAESTAKNFSSMLQDVRRNAPTEIDAICGAIVNAGRKYGVPTPLNETMTALIKARVAR